MKKILFILLICLPAVLLAQSSENNFREFYIGMKKSEIEKMLQKEAIRKGVSFSLENYRINDFSQIDMPPEIKLKDNETEAYIIEDDQIVFINGLLAILSLKIDSENKSEPWSKMVKTFSAKYGEGEIREDYHYWLSDDAFLLIQNGSNRIRLNALRRDLFPMHYLDKDKKKNSEETDETDEPSETEDAISDEYFTLSFFNNLKLGTPIKEVEEIIQAYYNEPFSINDYLKDLSGHEELLLDFENKKYTKYEIRECSFIFHDGAYIGGENELILSKNELEELEKGLDNKYNGHKALSSNDNINIWSDDDTVISIESSEYSTIVRIIPKRYLSEYAKTSLLKQVKEAKVDYMLEDIFLLDLGTPKEDVVKALRKSTSNPEFDLELNKEDIENADLPENMNFNPDNTEAYMWNGLALVFVDNKLNLAFMDTKRAKEKAYEEAKAAISKKYGTPSPLEEKGDVWVTDKVILILIFDGYKLGAGLVNKSWLSKKELDELQMILDKNK